MLTYQFHWKHRAAMRKILAATTSINAIRNDLCGERPAVAIDSKIPSKLQGTIKLPDWMPFNAFSATSSAFIAPEEAAIILVSCGLLLFSTTASDHGMLAFNDASTFNCPLWSSTVRMIWTFKILTRVCLDCQLIHFIYAHWFACIINIFFNHFFISHTSYQKNVTVFFHKIISNNLQFKHTMSGYLLSLHKCRDGLNFFFLQNLC